MVKFTHLLVADFGWENTILQQEDFKKIIFIGNGVFICTQDNNKQQVLKGKYEAKHEPSIEQFIKYSDDMAGKTCITCKWGNAEPDEVITTCGTHLENFASSSSCASWESDETT